MTAFAFAKSGYCTYSAAACASAPNMEYLDTAINAVSIAISLEIPVLCT